MDNILASTAPEDNINMGKSQPLSSSEIPSHDPFDDASEDPSDAASEEITEMSMEEIIELFKTTDAFDHLETPPGLRAYQVYPFSTLYDIYFGEDDEDDDSAYDDPELFYAWQSN